MLCALQFHWIELNHSGVAYIDFHRKSNQQINFTRLEKCFFALCKIYIHRGCLMHHKFNEASIPNWTWFPQLKSNTIHTKKGLGWYHSVVVVGVGDFFFYLCGKYVTNKPSFQSYRTTQQYNRIFWNRVGPKIVLKFYAIAQLFCTKYT